MLFDSGCRENLFEICRILCLRSLYVFLFHDYGDPISIEDLSVKIMEILIHSYLFRDDILRHGTKNVPLCS